MILEYWHVWRTYRPTWRSVYVSSILRPVSNIGSSLKVVLLQIKEKSKQIFIVTRLEWFLRKRSPCRNCLQKTSISPVSEWPCIKSKGLNTLGGKVLRARIGCSTTHLLVSPFRNLQLDIPIKATTAFLQINMPHGSKNTRKNTSKTPFCAY